MKNKDIYQEINERFEPASINNGRAIVRGIIDRAVARPSESKFQEIEADFGFPFDYSPADEGNEPRILTE